MSSNCGKLPLSVKLAFGAGELGPAMIGSVLIFNLLYFLTNVAGISASLAANIYMIGKVWDAINDPLAGVISDKTRHKWGRRMPWMVYGAVPFAAFFMAQWFIPQFFHEPARNVWPLFWYYVVVAILSNLFYTIVTLPYGAMTAELTEDYDERISLNSYRFAFSIGGSILGLIIVQVAFAIVKDPAQSYLAMGWICTFLALAALVWCIAGTWKPALEYEKRRLSAEKSVPPIGILEQVKIAFQNRPFLFVCAIYLFSWLGVQATAAVLPYYVVNVLGLDMAQFSFIALTVQGVALLMLPVWGAIAKRAGKTQVYFYGMIIWIIAQAGLLFLDPKHDKLIWVLAVMAGFGVSVAYLIPWAMMPEVIDWDELKTGHRREGVFYGFMVLLQKLGLALGIFLVGKGLAQAGFLESQPGMPPPMQPDSALTAIRISIGPLPTIALTIGMLLAWFYPITRAKAAEISEQLRMRRSLARAATVQA
ncbi:MAG TPA: MFS transporter [Chthoniobacterales bacterium]